MNATGNQTLVNRLLGIVLAVGIGLTQPLPAHALDFGFEFFNLNGNVNGLVTGRILGLNDNTPNQAASSVIIDTLPSVYSPVGTVPSPGSFGSSILSWPEFTANNFSVAGGEITSFDVRRSTGINGQLFFLSDTQFGGEAFFGEDVDGDGFSDDLFTGSFDLGIPQNVFFTPLSQPNVSFGALFIQQPGPITLLPNNPVPEPSTVILLASGIMGLLGWRHRPASYWHN